MRILDVTGKEIDLQNPIPKDHLTPEQQKRLRELLLSFCAVFLGGIGKMKLKPYELPEKKGGTPKAKRPYPIPLIHREATLREVERLVKLGVLEPDKDSPWAAKPLAFWSKKCNQAQERYTMNKKELVSIVEMLREFRTILWGREIKVYTDHKNSVESTFRNAQMLMWRLEIEEYGVTMIYVRGRENIVVDALSRLPLREEPMLAAAAKLAAEEPPEFSLSLEEIAETQQHVGL
ncbi:Pol Polyprotein [Phytophthora megakarya]|uniref:Pol Polyprotein n=1 Tax=Phytophthora megakarya TaxID=4795 RepID=A0A225W921_9STRA|nr:Pol Polyprotein [Phytophthora megakarya]